jgi:Methyl-viologen-reducing hydrogenase, delta subunit
MTVKRITFLQELLAFMGLEGRLHLEWISSAEAQKFVRVITDFTEKIMMLGPNPLPKYRGFQAAAGSEAAVGWGKSQPIPHQRSASYF